MSDPIFASAKDYLLPNSQLGGYDGGVGVMQVSGAVGEKYGYTKTELARDPYKNIDAGTAYLSSFNTSNPALAGKQYNGAAAYGQRIQAQVNNPNYNTNVVTYGLQQVVKSLKSIVKRLKG
ncbi:transglycosylase SLT domain-containing protein [Candidatus Saccharibacteria bacterium]|nr:transglycosylase SLT domain-containing protein [Candidatus Saccharibacteria bacterium]MCB9811651.1 transglycosylase SLT domain-containing protein [Candidatus Nomurabacteria bacterium]